MSNRYKKRLKKKHLTILIILVPLLIAGYLFLNDYFLKSKLTKASLNNHTLYLERAIDAETRQIGLMYRNYMPENQGMLFTFPEVGNYTIWMKNTFIPLDLVFLDNNYKVVDTKENLPTLSEEKHGSKVKHRHILELNAGTVKRLGVKAGQVLKILKKKGT